MKKTLHIFGKDLSLALRQFLTFWIILAPVLLAVVVNLVTPGISDTPITIAMLRADDAARIAAVGRYAEVELFDTVAAAERRVEARDDVPAILPDGAGGAGVVAEGNEPAGVVTAAKVLLAYAELGMEPDDTGLVMHSFGRAFPPVKVTLAAALVVLVTVLSGMLIAINLVEEKEDGTIRAMRVAPVTLSGFVAGKSLLGVANSAVGALLVLLVCGFFATNLAQVLVVVLATSLLSFVVGFMTGLSSDDFIGAAASLKILMLPALLPILGVELLGAQWQWAFYWDPFYWAYVALKGVLSQTAHWGTVLFAAGMVVGITAVVYLLALPFLKKRLR